MPLLIDVYKDVRRRESALIDIESLRKYYSEDNVFMTEHAAERFRLRGIKVRDIQCALRQGEIIEQYPDDYPFPSCLVYGTDSKGRVLHICMSDEGTSSRIITAYYPDSDKWTDDLKVRKEQGK